MKVSDKDLDQLFSSKLGDLEMEPSANVWGNITDELDGKKEEKREVKGGLPFMKIAAGIVLLMAVGLYFIRPEQQKIELRASTITTNDVQGDRVTAPAQPTVDYAESPVVADVRPSVKRQQTKAVVNHTANVFARQVDTAQSMPQYVAAVNHQTESPVIAQVPTIQNQKQGLVPDVKASSVIADANVLAAKTNNPVMANTGNNKPEQTKKHRIHSLGDLLNVVIAKVDKREDKLIEFTNTSDEDSFTVTGVNLGLLKAKKDK